MGASCFHYFEREPHHSKHTYEILELLKALSLAQWLLLMSPCLHNHNGRPWCSSIFSGTSLASPQKSKSTLPPLVLIGYLKKMHKEDHKRCHIATTSKLKFEIMNKVLKSNASWAHCALRKSWGARLRQAQGQIGNDGCSQSLMG